MNHRKLWLGIGTSILGVMAASGTLGTNAMSMVDSWTGGTGKIYYTGGDIGIGTSAPSWQLHSVWSGTDEGAIYGQSTATTGSAYGVEGRTSGPDGFGVVGIATHATGSVKGVFGQVLNSTSGSGVSGVASATTGYTFGVRGDNNSINGMGVRGGCTSTGATDATYGVFGATMGGAGAGVRGEATHTSGFNFGVYGTSASSAGIGVYGGAPTTGVYGEAPATGVYGKSTGGTGIGVYGLNTAGSGTPLGVVGAVGVAAGRGVLGDNSASGGVAIQGQVSGSTAVGVYGIASSTASSTQAKGVYGESGTELGIGVKGKAAHASGVNYGVLGETASGTNGFGLYAIGRTGATGTKSFQIDHPLDPEHKYLNHFSAEGPEPYLIYRGNVTLDGAGEAWVELPEYFEAINRDYTYQLTPIGQPGMLYVAQEIEDSAFRIAGGLPGGKVSWTVTGVRDDAFVRANPLPTEQLKPLEQVGKYLMPELFGKGPEEGVFFETRLQPVALSRGSGEVAPR